MAANTFAGCPIQDAESIIAERDDYSDHPDDFKSLGKANLVFNPSGFAPLRGWFLVHAGDFANVNTYQSQSATIMDGFGTQVTLTGLYVVAARSPWRQIPNDPLMPLLVEVTDARGLLRNGLYETAVETAYNTRAPAYDGSYYSGSLNAGAAWTWSTMLQDLWTRASLLGAFPGFPGSYTPIGTPENWSFPGTSAWVAICQILDHLACAVCYDPVAGTYSIVHYGDADSVFTAQATTSAPYLTEDEVPNIGAAGSIPGTLNVYFHRRDLRYGAAETVRRDAGQWENAVAYTVPVATGFAGPGVAFMWDDFTVRYDENSQPLAADVTTANTLAAARTLDYLAAINRGGQGEMHQTYAGLQLFKTGSLCDAVVWQHRPPEPKTEVKDLGGQQVYGPPDVPEEPRDRIDWTTEIIRDPWGRWILDEDGHFAPDVRKDDSSNAQAPNFVPSLPNYPIHIALLRVYGVPLVTGATGTTGLKSLNVYRAFNQQWYGATGNRDREFSYAVEPNNAAVGPGYYLSRLVSEFGLTGINAATGTTGGATGATGPLYELVALGSSSPTFSGPATFLSNVFVEGSVNTGLSPTDYTNLTTNLTQTQIAVLANLDACQLKVFLQLSTVNQQLVTTNLTYTQLWKLLLYTTSAQVTTIVTTLTTVQLQTLTTNIGTDILKFGTPLTSLLTLITTLTNSEVVTLTSIVSLEQLSNLLLTMTAVQIQTLTNSTTSSQLLVIVEYTEPQLESITVNLTTIVALTDTRLKNLKTYTPQQISVLLTNLTAVQLETLLDLTTTSMDISTVFNGQSSTTISTTQNNVSVVNKLYLPYNPTTLTIITGFVPTSPQLPQLIHVVNTNTTNSLQIPNNSGSSTYPVIVPSGNTTYIKPKTVMGFYFDPTLAVWVALVSWNNPMTAVGDITYANAIDGTPVKLAIGPTGTVLTALGVPTWSSTPTGPTGVTGFTGAMGAGSTGPTGPASGGGSSPTSTNGQVTVTSAYSLTNSYAQVTGLNFSAPSTGTYLLVAQITFNNAGALTTPTLQAKIRNTTAGADYGTFSSVTIGLSMTTEIITVPIVATASLTSGDNVEVQVENTGGAGGTIDRGNLVYVKLA